MARYWLRRCLTPQSRREARVQRAASPCEYEASLSVLRSPSRRARERFAVVIGLAALGLVGACSEGPPEDASPSVAPSTGGGPVKTDERGPSAEPEPEIPVGASVRKDGNGRIAFVAEKFDSPDETVAGFERIYTVEPDGTGLQVLLEARRQGYSADHYYGLGWTPDGEGLTVVSESLRGSPHFTLYSNGRSRSTLRLHRPIFVSSAAWAPDGRLLTYTTFDEVRVLDTKTDADRVVWAAPPQAARSGVSGRLSWASGSEITAAIGSPGSARLRVIDVITGETRTVPARFQGISDALVSPDGTAAAVLPDSRTDCSRDLAIVDLRTGRAHPVTDQCVSPGGFDWSPDGERLLFTNFAAFIEDEASLWSAPAEGGAATELLTAGSIGADRLGAVSWQPTDR